MVVSRRVSLGERCSEPKTDVTEARIVVDLPGMHEGYLHGLRFESVSDDLVEACLVLGGCHVIRFTRADLEAENALARFVDGPLPLHLAKYHKQELSFRFARFSEVEEIDVKHRVFEKSGDVVWVETSDGDRVEGHVGEWKTVVERTWRGKNALPDVVVTLEPARKQEDYVEVGVWQRVDHPGPGRAKRVDDDGTAWTRNELRFMFDMCGLKWPTL